MKNKKENMFFCFGMISFIISLINIKNTISFLIFTSITIICFFYNRKTILRILARPIIRRIHKLKKEKKKLLRQVTILRMEKKDILSFFDNKSNMDFKTLSRLKRKIIVLEAEIEQLEEKKKEIEEDTKELNSISNRLNSKRNEYNILKEKTEEVKKEINNLNNQKRYLKYKKDFIENCNIEKIDILDGLEFEKYFAELLSILEYKSASTQSTGDYGIDVIAEKDGIRYGFQCKLYSQLVGNKAIQEAYSGKTYYNCHVAIVVTNSYFTSNAINQAEKNGVVLWDRNKLTEIISQISLSETIPEDESTEVVE